MTVGRLRTLGTSRDCHVCPARRVEGVDRGSLDDATSDSGITPAVLYKTVLLAFGLVIAAMIFSALASLVFGVLIVVIIAAPLSAFADMLKRWHIPRAVGATLGLLLGLGAAARAGRRSRSAGPHQALHDRRDGGQRAALMLVI
jgi:hypothetical protein